MIKGAKNFPSDSVAGSGSFLPVEEEECLTPWQKEDRTKYDFDRWAAG